MGTPDFAVPSLDALCERHEVIGAVTAPDKPRSRNVTTPTPVALRAEELGIPVFKPVTLRDGALLPTLEELSPDVIVVVAYGKILPDYVLEYPAMGCVNVHGSLLPRYRGAAPMQRAIMDGVTEIGVTVMRMDSGLDTGDMLLPASLPLDPEADFEWVHDALARLGAKTLIDALDGLCDGSVVPQKQDDSLATYAAKITRDDCRLDFGLPAARVHDTVRALSPVPLAFTLQRGRILKIVSCRVAGTQTSEKPGTVLECTPDGFTVACGEGVLLVTEVVPEGKRRMSAADFARGRGVLPGDTLGL